MDTNKFVKLLRKIIKEEVSTAIKAELRPYLTEMTKPAVKKHKKILDSKPSFNAPQQPKKNPTFNGPLASILEETYQSMVNNPEEDEWPSMNGETFTSQHANEMGMFMQSSAPATQQRSAPADPSNLLMKDYSELLQKANQIAQGNRM